MRARRSTAALYAAVTVAALIWLIPVVTALMISLRPPGETRQGWWHLEPFTITLESYAEALNGMPPGTIRNTFIITLGAVLVTVFGGVLASYAIVRIRFRGRVLLYFLLVTTMIVPLQLILIPLLPWTRQLGLLGGQWRPFVAIILAHAAFGAGWAVFMIASFLRNIPSEVLEAAQVDGANHWDTFRRIVLPLAIPGVVSFAIIDFIFVWNDLLLALTLFGTRGEVAPPIQVALSNLQSQNLPRQDVVSAAAMMAILPPLVLFALLNRYYVRGMFAGGAKG
jgi:ABC-type glycerol-3-phosphate transport system permease component